ncbi:type 2 lantibiotic biosynthesis protein [Anaerocolumna cellulosilytica]|uniref:Type 2 lantibiotic biosynthesis protein n=1 Tax=Anaerocolumna cellulosilytica TaxID=433286 RepID=A0A6S6R3N8_9FIRM|nr:type 2 lanthipeptide synthetase LanM family protein [Anaerocolumna cellulosilytica]MBB5196718.1 type 2 lantibiotic biosynthesis protein LanM [Anaerocolumna cellulosilytica]BCJ93980.1 type 2 lantibiotic biosynthesis protein [Anaerocolumna cellulosilytica]
MFKNLERSSVLYERIYKFNGILPEVNDDKYWERILGKSMVEKIQQNPDLVKHINNEEYENCKDIFREIWLLNRIFEETLFLQEEPLLKIQEEDFEVFFTYFLKLAQFYLKQKQKKSSHRKDEIIKDYLKAIYNRLKTLSIRILINEIHLLKEEGLLEGVDTKEEYAYYQKNYLGDIHYIYEIGETYPVLMRSIFETIASFTDFTLEVLNRLQKDREELAEYIFEGEQMKEILSFEADIADTHLHNTVIRLTFDNKKSIIYKPYSLKKEISYQKLVNWFYKKCDMTEFHRVIIDKGHYGWEEEILQKSCQNELELKTYYTRLGINLFVNFLLNTCDLHCENIIACGEYPVVIDLETLVGIGGMDADTTKGKIHKILMDSVLYLGVLPALHWKGKRGGVNLSGMNGYTGQTVPFKIPCIRCHKTSEIAIDYRNPITHGGKNLAKLNGRYIESKNYTKELLLGFEKAYTVGLSNKDTIISFMSEVKTLKSRYLLRDTQFYSALLLTSYHPDFMMDGGDRNLFLYQLFERGYLSYAQNIKCSKNKMGARQTLHMVNNIKIVEAEIKELLKGNIPVFYIRVDNKELILPDGRRLKGYLHSTAYDNVIAKINALSYTDLERQSLFIRITMGENFIFRKDKLLINSMDNKKGDIRHIYQAVERIGDMLVKEAIYNKDFTDVNWIGIFNSMTGDGTKIFQPLNPYLYDGIAGLAIFMNALNKVIKKSSYSKLCKALDTTLFSYTESYRMNAEADKECMTGAFSGEASIVYTYQILYQLTNNIVYLEYAKRHVKPILSAIEKDCKYDVLNGNGGFIILLCNLYKLTKEEEYIAAANEAARILSQSAITMPEGIGWKLETCPVPLAGFSHGNSGMAVAFGVISQITGSKEYLPVINELLMYEESLYSASLNSWVDLREGKKSESTASWCHGASGILLSRLFLVKVLGSEYSERLGRDISRAVKNVIESEKKNSYCLCHGNCGNMHILKVYERCMPQNEFVKQITFLQISELAFNIGNGTSDIKPAEYNHPGFMTGITGIGYCLLGFINEHIPDVLSLSLL